MCFLRDAWTMRSGTSQAAGHQSVMAGRAQVDRGGRGRGNRPGNSIIMLVLRTAENFQCLARQSRCIGEPDLAVIVIIATEIVELAHGL
jgi:hypothetical protein